MERGESSARPAFNLQTSGEEPPLLSDSDCLDSPPFASAQAFLSDRLAADPRFLEKMGVEILIDGACTLTAEVLARGEAVLGSQSVFVLDDLVTTVLLDVCIVSIVAPSAAKAEHTQEHSAEGRHEWGAGHLWRAGAELAASLPNSAFEARPRDDPGHPGYTPLQRVLAAVSTALQYGLLGLVCGGVGQEVTNLISLSGDALDGSATLAPLPGVVPVALLWSRYMAVNASVRYQLVGAVENAAERSALASNPLALTAVSATTRLANNVYGAMLFVEMMRASGISP